jgi:heterotetrameric sarcosine oxidase delta subunit
VRREILLYIPCPWCGEREELEFHYHDEGHIVRPDVSVGDGEWSSYLYERENVEGWQRDLWSHDAGCRRYFYVLRHSVTDEIGGAYKVGEKLPPLPAEAEREMGS